MSTIGRERTRFESQLMSFFFCRRESKRRMKDMRFEVFAETDVGLRREINQDSILVDHDLCLYIVADGMGGHRGGEVASLLAVQTMQQHIRKNSKGTQVAKSLLIDAYRDASAKIHHKSTVESPDLMGMGTTMVSFYSQNGRAYISNVGDSRAYLFRDSHLWQLTDDHSLINEQIKAGVIREEDAEQVVGRNVITRSVGYERDVQTDILERELTPGDQFLLCSDGLSALVEIEKIQEICNSYKGIKIVSECINEAKKAGGDDNVSVIFIRYLGA